MISKLSQKITEILCRLQLIESEEQNLYFYGMFMVLSQTLFLIVALIFGLLFSSFWESITFYVLFSSLRCYAGGIHASKENACTLYTVVALFLSVVCIYAQKSINNSSFSSAVIRRGVSVMFFSRASSTFLIDSCIFGSRYISDYHTFRNYFSISLVL